METFKTNKEAHFTISQIPIGKTFRYGDDLLMKIPVVESTARRGDFYNAVSVKSGEMKYVSTSLQVLVCNSLVIY